MHELFCQECGYKNIVFVDNLTKFSEDPPDCMNPTGSPHKFAIRASLLPVADHVVFRWYNPISNYAIEFEATNVEQFRACATYAALDARRKTKTIHGTSFYYPEMILELKIGSDWIWPKHVNDQHNCRLPSRGSPIDKVEIPAGDADVVRNNYRHWWAAFSADEQIRQRLSSTESA